LNPHILKHKDPAIIWPFGVVVPVSVQGVVLPNFAALAKRYRGSEVQFLKFMVLGLPHGAKMKLP
jgi:hypothetical protein